jgi:hypothetical protein
MLFIEWEAVIRWAIALLIAALCFFAFWSIRKKRAWLRWTVRSVALIILIMDAFVASVLVDFGTSYSKAVFSPDRSMAARVVYENEAGERDAEVEVFRRHGLSHETVYEGRPLLTEKEVHWLDGKNLWLVDLDPFLCTSTDFVAIHCGVAISPPASKTPVVQRLILLINDRRAQAPSPRQDPPSESRSAR